MNLRYRSIVAVLFIMSLCLISSCAGGNKVKKPKYDCGKRMEQAIAKFNKKQYTSVKTMLEDIKQTCAGASMLDTASYYLAMSLFRMKLYPEAKLEFTRLMQEFPNSPYYEEALFMIAYSVFKGSRSVDRDQTETQEAYRLFSDFIENYPSSAFADSAQKYLKVAADKLALKEYDAARFYLKIGEKEAAAVYLKSFIKDFPGSSYTKEAKLLLGQTLCDLKRFGEAKEVLEELIAQEPDSEAAKKAQGLLARCKG